MFLIDTMKHNVKKKLKTCFFFYATNKKKLITYYHYFFVRKLINVYYMSIYTTYFVIVLGEVTCYGQADTQNAAIFLVYLMALASLWQTYKSFQGMLMLKINVV